MELKNYFFIVCKRWWIVVSLPVIAALIAGYCSLYVLSPVYESNTTLYVINKKDDSQILAYNDLMAGQFLVKDYRELVKSRTVTGTVIEELGLSGMTAEKLAGKISINSKNDTRIIEIRVQDISPETARMIADKVGEVFVAKVVELMKVENVSIVDKAQLPGKPLKPNPLMNTAIAFLAGLIAAIGAVFLVEYLDDTIKNAEDVEKYLGLTVLGTIPEFNLK